MMTTRRGFLGLAACGGFLLPKDVFGALGKPIMTFGVISDVHIGGRTASPVRLETALRWLGAHKADAVLSPGDIAHSGLIKEMEGFAAIWYKVFPNGRRADGEPVKLMISTGNHDAAATWIKGTPAWREANVLAHGDNFSRVWERLFHDTFELVWRREVKGVTFMGAQWPSLNPKLEAYMAEHGAEFDPSKPFFHCQHQHPRYTCHGAYSCGDDAGQSVRAFAKFPNAVVFSGHSHCTIADERAVWQGAFTSVGAGCLHEGGLAFDYDNCTAKWHPSFRTKLMKPLNDPEAWGGDPDGACFEFVEVYSDHIVVHRRSSVYDAAIGPAWAIPIPAKTGGVYDFAKRHGTRSAPQFAADAKLKVEVCPKGCDAESKARAGEPCVRVTIPAARTVDGCRVFTYGIRATADGKEVASGKVFAAGFSLPETEADRPTDWLVALKDLPAGKDILFTVEPRECFDMAGRAISAHVAV